MAIGWKVVGQRGLAPGEVVRPDERLPWHKTIGIGAQHVVAMFGATFVFPIVAWASTRTWRSSCPGSAPSFSATQIVLRQECRPT